MTMRSTDYALLSQATYNDPDIESRGPNGVTYKKVTLDGIEYRPIAHADNPKNGFQATAYERQDGSHAVVIAYRGTEFGREPMQDGLVDASMAVDGTNAQIADSNAFTEKVLADAKQKAEAYNYPLDVTVTGHSLGGTLAEINAYQFGLHGETFNAFGAAGLMQGVPEGGHQIIDHVRATDVVSAASAHFGQVRAYALPQDTHALYQAGYTDSALLNAMPLHSPVLGTIQADAHAIDNFVPDSKLLGHSILTAQNEKYAQAHRDVIQSYRDDIHLARSLAVTEYQWHKPILDVAAIGAETAVHTAQTLERHTVDAYHRAVDVTSHGIEAGMQWGTALARQEMHAYELIASARPVSLDHPAHPDHALYKQARVGVYHLDAGLGRTPDKQSDQLAAALVVAAKREGMASINEVHLSEDGTHAFAVQGQLDSPLRQFAQVQTAEAVNTPIDKSSAAALAVVKPPEPVMPPPTQTPTHSQGFSR